MGIKPCKPVVPYDECKTRLEEADLACIQRMFRNVTRSGDTDGLISKAVFAEQIGSKFGFGVPVIDRLFTVLDTDGSKSLNYKEFLCAMFIFLKGSRPEKLTLVFNMFDVRGSGSIQRKEFQRMLMALIVGDNVPRWNVAVPLEDGTQEMQPVGLEYFKAMSDMMIEMAILEYDRDNDNKLSFEEWCKYAEEDEAILAFLDSMEAVARGLGTEGPGGSAASRSSSAASSSFAAAGGASSAAASAGGAAASGGSRRT